MTNELFLLNRLDEDIKWFKANQERLEEEYSDEFIAVKGKKVVANNKELDSLLNTLRELGLDPSDAFIRFVSITTVIL